MIRKGYAAPVGSLTQLGTISLGKRTEDRVPKAKDFAPLQGLDGFVFGGWDAFPDDAYEAAVHAEVLEEEHLGAVHDELRAVELFPSVFEPRDVARIEATHKKEYGSLREAADQVREDIRAFKKEHGLERVAMVNCASTEAYAQPQKAHFDPEELEAALERSDPSVSPARPTPTPPSWRT